LQWNLTKAKKENEVRHPDHLVSMPDARIHSVTPRRPIESALAGRSFFVSLVAFCSSSEL
jgi:hypothetical protein